MTKKKISKNFRNRGYFKPAFIYFVLLCVFCKASIAAPEINKKKVDIKKTVIEKIMVDGVESGLDLYRKYEASGSEKYILGENVLNTIGIRLYRNKKKYDDAVTVIRYAINKYPRSANLIDTLAEGYLWKFNSLGNNADLDSSEQNYQKALKMKPGFSYSVAGLKKIYVIRNYDKREYMVPMRDGIKLFTQVYTPKNKSEKYPFLMDRTPYNASPKGENKLDYRNTLGPHHSFTKEGFIFVRQDVRGRYLSEGKFLHVRPVVSQRGDSNLVDESTDTYDTIKWLLNTIPNHNGRAGMFGCSYGGFYSIYGAINAHPALVAVTPQAPVADWFIGDDWHHNGAFFLFQALGWMGRNDFDRKEPASTRPGSENIYPYS